MSADAEQRGLPEGAFVGRETFRDHLRAGFKAAAERGWPELLLCDADFQAWPLGEREVVEALHAWARHGQRFTMLARTFDEVPRQHARFVEWRRVWSHKIDCRICREADPMQLPSALWSPAWSLRRLDPLRSHGLCGEDPGFRLTLREEIDGWLERGVAGFPAYTVGL
ncbi:MAG: hypothetical protein Q4G70_10340 [Pseudomonadota bacterium]|nr:hypothetical protein [Pseudomonadota bacterium]